jgi:hypothetical protein
MRCAQLEGLNMDYFATRAHPFACDGKRRGAATGRGARLRLFEASAARRSRLRILPEFGRTNVFLLQEGIQQFHLSATSSGRFTRHSMHSSPRQPFRRRQHARLIPIRELDACGHEGTLDIVKSASVGSSPA